MSKLFCSVSVRNIFARYDISNSAPVHTRYLANLQLVMLALCGGHVIFPSRGRGGGGGALNTGK